MVLNYAKLIKQQRIRNAAFVDISEEKTKEKIKKFAKDFNLDFNDTYKDVETSKYFKYLFATNPVKQNLFESIALDYLQNMNLISDATKLPPAGTGAFYVIEKQLIPGNPSGKSSKKQNQSQSIDFQLTIEPYKKRTNQLIVYAYHKYIKEAGGGQNHQLADIEKFLSNAPNDREECFIVFADGHFLRKHRPRLKAKYDILSHIRTYSMNEFEAAVLTGEII